MPLVLSARDAVGLRVQAGRWGRWLRAHPETDNGALKRTAAWHRTPFDARAFVVADSVPEAIAGLATLSSQAGRSLVGRSVASEASAVMFTGQGSQHARMGLALAHRPGLEVFTEVFEAAIGACDAHLPSALADVLAGDDDRVSLTQFAQPALFALETAL